MSRSPRSTGPARGKGKKEDRHRERKGAEAEPSAPPNAQARVPAPATLAEWARSHAELFCSFSNRDTLPVDAYGALAREAALLYERQRIFDALDGLPYHESFVDVDAEDSPDDEDDGGGGEEDRRSAEEAVARLTQSLDRVVECHRASTGDGFTSILAAVNFREFSRLGGGGDENGAPSGGRSGGGCAGVIRLSFSYERRPVPRRAVPPPPTSTVKGHHQTNETDTTNGKKRKRGKTTGDVVDDDDRRGGGGDSAVAPSAHNSASAATATEISYVVKLSRDHGPSRPLLRVDVVAEGDGPSPEPAVPMTSMSSDCDDDEDSGGGSCEEFDEDGRRMEVDRDGAIGAISPPSSSSSSGEENGDITKEGRRGVGSGSSDCRGAGAGDGAGDGVGGGGGDRYAAYVDPDVLVEFLAFTGLRERDADGDHFRGDDGGDDDGVGAPMLLDEYQSVALPMLAFPHFHEHEWDLLGFLVRCCLGDGEDDDDDDDEGEDDG